MCLNQYKGSYKISQTKLISTDTAFKFLKTFSEVKKRYCHNLSIKAFVTMVEEDISISSFSCTWTYPNLKKNNPNSLLYKEMNSHRVEVSPSVYRQKRKITREEELI